MFFSDGIVVSHDFGKNRQEALDAIDAYKSTGGTALYDAVISALNMLKRQDTRRAVVVMTDGRDENNAGTAPGSRQTLADVLNLSKNVDAAIFPIGLGSNVDRSGLEEVAGVSGGRAVVSIGCHASRIGVPRDHREPATPLCHRLYLDSRRPRRLVA